jgi:hypothetical protein
MAKIPFSLSNIRDMSLASPASLALSLWMSKRRLEKKYTSTFKKNKEKRECLDAN